MLYIYPSKPDKKTFDENKDELGQKKEKKKKETAEEFMKNQTNEIEQEWFKMYNELGLISDFRQRLIQNYAGLEKKILDAKDKTMAEHTKTFRQIETQNGVEKKENLEKDKIVQQFHSIAQELPKYKENVSKLTISRMKQDI